MKKQRSRPSPTFLGLDAFCPVCSNKSGFEPPAASLIECEFLSLTERGSYTTFAQPHFAVWGYLNYCSSTKM